MIRTFKKEDTEAVMRIWLNGNLEAHGFVPADYWRENLPMVEEQLPEADIFVWEENGSIRGFLGIQDGFIAGIFVDSSCRSEGIGKKLLDHAKTIYPSLSLKVYQKNTRAAGFYFREGFFAESEGMDEETGEPEYTMVWKAGEETADIWARLCGAARNVQAARWVSDRIEAGQVAAALMTKSGAIYTGICIVTACSLGMCAERNAIAHMLTCGESEIEKLAVIGPDGDMALPCGACMEFMMQLGKTAGEIEILVDEKRRETRRLKELIPSWWGAGHSM